MPCRVALLQIALKLLLLLLSQLLFFPSSIQKCHLPRDSDALRNKSSQNKQPILQEKSTSQFERVTDLAYFPPIFPQNTFFVKSHAKLRLAPSCDRAIEPILHPLPFHPEERFFLGKRVTCPFLGKEGEEETIMCAHTW